MALAQPTRPADAAAATGAPQASRFTSARGRQLEIICGFEEIVSTRTQAPVAMRITPTVIDRDRSEVLRSRALASLEPEDFWHIDLAVVQAADPLLRQATLPTMAPISVHSLARARSRDKLFAESGVNTKMSAVAMIAEIVGIDQSTPGGRLNDALPLIRPLASAVFVEAVTPTMVDAVAVNGVAGVSMDFRDSAPGDRDSLTKMMHFGAAGTARVRNVVARGLPGFELLTHADRWGITHASKRARAPQG